jgi:hypothetical protein
MGKDQLAVLRGHLDSSSARPKKAPSTQSSAGVAAESLPPADSLAILALAASIRLDDPRDDHERVVAVEVAIVAGRAAAHGLDRWLSQSLAECRGSRTAWDLEATTAELRAELEQFDTVLRDTAGRLITLIPGLFSGRSETVPVTASDPKRRRVLDEVAAASSLLDAIESRLKLGSGRAGRG